MTPKKTAKELQEIIDHQSLFDRIVTYCDEHFANKWTEKLVIGFVIMILIAFATAWIATVVK
jgi:hypothetical protein